MSQQTTKNGYIVQADVIRLIAILGVVFIHLVYGIYSRPDFLGGATWWLTNILNAFSRVSIPLFIMLSGYLMIPKSESVKSTLYRTVKRILIPLFFWAGFYLWWMADFHGKPYDVQEILSMLVMSNVYNYYFLIILAGLYLLLPVIRTLVQCASKTVLWYLVAISIGAGMVLYLSPYVFLPDVTLLNSFTIWFPFLGYFLLGYLLKTPPKSMTPWMITFLLAFVCTIGLGYWNVSLRSQGIETFWRSSGVSYFDEYLSPAVIIMSMSLFQILLHSRLLATRASHNKFIVSGLKQVSKAAFAVYLIHGFVIDYLELRQGFAFEYLDTNLLTYFLTKSFLTIALSFVLGSILVRLPIVKWVFGEK